MTLTHPFTRRKSQITLKAPKHAALPDGRQIKFRSAQMLLWSVVAGFVGAGFIAGLYFGILQVNWGIFWLKPWWDGLFNGSSTWAVYRHTAFRDIPEPAFATMGVMTLLAKPKYWDKRVGTARLALTPLLIIVLTFALGIFGTWLLNFAFGHPVLTWHSAGDLILGFLIGRILHATWAPVGATFQGQALENRADAAANRGRVPAWVWLPVMPPVIRERFSSMYKASRKVTGNLFQANHGPWRKVLVITMLAVFTLITVIGLLGHYYAGTGHVIPFLPTTAR